MSSPELFRQIFRADSELGNQRGLLLLQQLNELVSGEYNRLCLAVALTLFAVANAAHQPRRFLALAVGACYAGMPSTVR